MGNNKITEHRAIFQREKQNSSINKQTKSVNNQKTGKKTLTISEIRVARFGSNSYKPITNTAWVCLRLCKLQKECTRLAVASEKSLPVACPWSVVLFGYFHH
jgi:hypothetical protein